MSAFCSRCGSPLKAGVRFCPKCGGAIAAPAAPPPLGAPPWPSPPPHGFGVPPVPPPVPPKSSGMRLLACLGCLGVMGLVVAAAIVVPWLIPADLKSGRNGTSGPGDNPVDVTSDIGEDQVGRGEPDEPSPPKPALTLERLASQTVQPSDQEQTVSWEDRVKVTIPGGVLKDTRELTISRASNEPPQALKCLKGLETYDLSAGDLHEFDKPLALEFAYDPQQVVSDVPAEQSLCVGYWDDQQKVWQMTEVGVDAEKHRVKVSTKHLCLWCVYYVAKGYTIKHTEHFNIVYNPEARITFAEAGPPVNGKVVGKVEYGNEATQRIASYLEYAYAQYLTRKYRSPFLLDAAVGEEVHNHGDADRLWVFVGFKDWYVTSAAQPDSEMSGFTGHLYLTDNYSSMNGLRQECAHELFHRFQNEYMNIVSLGRRGWWVEATADYAAACVAWNRETIGSMGENIKFRYIQTSITHFGGDGDPFINHQYHTAHLIDDMVRNGADFQAMWQATMDSPGPLDVMGSLDHYLHQATGKSLGDHYRHFAGRLLFDPTGPIGGEDGARLFAEGTSRRDQMGADVRTLPIWGASLRYGYTGEVWGIRVAVDTKVAPSRNLKVELLQDAGGHALADVYLLRGNRRVAGTIPEGTLINKGDATSVVAENGDVVYVLALCTSMTDSQDLEISVTEEGAIFAITPPRVEKEGSNKVRKFTAAARNIPKAVTRVECEWDFGDGSDAASFYSTELAGGRYQGEVTHQYAAGDHTMTARLYERAPRARELLSQVVVPISLVEKPFLTLDPGTYEGEPGKPITFTAKAANAPSGSWYEWSFGDTSAPCRTDEPSATYTYKEGGDFPVVVKVCVAEKKALAEASGSAVIRAVVAVPTTLKLELPGYWGHLSYTITGTRLDPPTGSSYGKVGGRHYQGRLAGDTLTVSGTAVSDNESSGPDSGDYYELVVSVKVGDKTKDFSYIAPKDEKLSQSFSLSVPIDPSATTGQFFISLIEQNANWGPHGWEVSGSLER